MCCVEQRDFPCKTVGQVEIDTKKLSELLLGNEIRLELGNFLVGSRFDELASAFGKAKEGFSSYSLASYERPEDDCVNEAVALSLASEFLSQCDGMDNTLYVDVVVCTYSALAFIPIKLVVGGDVYEVVIKTKCFTYNELDSAVISALSELCFSHLYTKEHEYKFLVDPTYAGVAGFEAILQRWKPSEVSIIAQAYMTREFDDFTTRVRYKKTLCSESGFVTIKGGSNVELESPVDLNFALSTISICGQSSSVYKVRAKIPFGELYIELDLISMGNNKYELLAEIEVPYPSYVLPDLPNWFGDDVSGQWYYTNANISQRTIYGNTTVSDFVKAAEGLLR